MVSDEANFQLNGSVNSQNTRRNDELKTSNREEGGRPADFAVESPTFDQKVIVFCGMKRDITFGLTVFRNDSMTGPRYHRLLLQEVSLQPVPEQGLEQEAHLGPGLAGAEP